MRTSRSFGELTEASIEAMEAQYPELRIDAERIRAVAEAEEGSFLQTLQQGSKHFDTMVDVASAQPGTPAVTGEVAFKLHDTYGFPIDLTLEMAEEKGLSVDTDGFRRLMKEQRDRAKADSKARKLGAADLSAYRDLLDEVGETTFTGYDEVVSEGRVRGLMVDGESVPSAEQGSEVELVLDRTPFYAEGGGQLADEGRIVLGNGALVEVLDVQSPVRGLVVHRASVLDGEVSVGEAAEGIVDLERRLAISRAHTATHMVHKAFREALGEGATQMGSENSPGRLRFDFPSPTAVPASVLADVEQRVNEVLLDDLTVTADHMSQAEAIALGAMALFGEKYGETVRVVSVGDWARELCGGTHLRRTGELGVVKLMGESSVGAGVRRVEALVGRDAYRFLAREHILVSQLADTLKARPEELPERIDGILTRLREAEREIDRGRAAQALAQAGELAGRRVEVGGVGLVAAVLPSGVRPADARTLALDVRGRVSTSGPAVVILGTPDADSGQLALVVASDPAAAERKAGAGTVMRILVDALGGKGGGKDDVAQGAGPGDPAAFEAAVERVRQALQS